MLWSLKQYLQHEFVSVLLSDANPRGKSRRRFILDRGKTNNKPNKWKRWHGGGTLWQNLAYESPTERENSGSAFFYFYKDNIKSWRDMHEIYSESSKATPSKTARGIILWAEALRVTRLVN